jgi:ectoine hydroxylase-related dioxygenase (phytanoyl-CoA dioxygenase family)
MNILSSLFQDEPVLFKDKINFKPPGGGGYSVHQDAPAYQGFGIPRFITAMIAIDSATTVNGCLEFAIGLRTTREFKKDGLGEIKASEIKGLEFQPVPVMPGDVIIFDDLAPHLSRPNQSDCARRAMFLTFNRKKDGDKRSEYFALKNKLFPPEDQRSPDRDYRKLGKQFSRGNPFL